MSSEYGWKQSSEHEISMTIINRSYIWVYRGSDSIFPPSCTTGSIMQIRVQTTFLRQRSEVTLICSGPTSQPWATHLALLAHPVCCITKSHSITSYYDKTCLTSTDWHDYDSIVLIMAHEIAPMKFLHRFRISQALWLLRCLFLLKQWGSCLLRPGQGPRTNRMRAEHLDSFLRLHSGNQTCTCPRWLSHD